MADYLRWDAHNFLHSNAYFHAEDFRMEVPPTISLDNPAPERPAEQDAGAHCPQIDSLRRQVLGIIASVLEDTDPACAGARSRLRRCLAHNVGSPEQALLEHLVSLHSSEMHGPEPCGSDLQGEPEEPQF
ncbi:hypothetical protein [Arthrobacter sp. NPDC056727]|uniref:hypothetical protein n=1 Tax=Arthrobacter sp. NPDC056727 TaxID=3345927 RepID=UPI00366FB1BA